MKPELQQVPAGHLRVWDHPQDGKQYVIGADVAEGKVRDKTLSSRRKLYSYSDQKPDYSAAAVIELESGMHVASWLGHINPYDYATALCALGIYYHQALLIVEINGPGLGTITTLAEALRYPHLYRPRQYAVLERQELAITYGWRTLPHTSPQLMQRIHEAIATANLLTRDRQLIDLQAWQSPREAPFAKTPAQAPPRRSKRITSAGAMVGSSDSRDANRFEVVGPVSSPISTHPKSSAEPSSQAWTSAASPDDANR